MITCKVQIGSILAKLRSVPREMHQVMEKVVEADAKGFVVDMVNITPPSMGNAKPGGSAEAGAKQPRPVTASKQRGEAAVGSDIRTVYASPGDLYALIRSYAGEPVARYYWHLVSNDPVGLQRWLDVAAPDAVRALARGWDQGAAHRKRRTRRGRVAGGKPSVRLRDAAEMRQMQAYIKQRQKRVGLLAAGFNAGALRLGVRLPAWVRRHGQPFSLVAVVRQPGRFSVTIGNRTPYVLGTDVPRKMQWVLGSEKRKKRLIMRAKAEVRAIMRRRAPARR